MNNLVGAIIFARMSSKRLPGKSLARINGRSLIGRVFDRSQAIQINGPIILATSNHPSDKPLISFAEREHLPVFCGPLHDVARRAFDCAKANELSAFVRICGDRPFHDPATASELVDIFNRTGADMATNCLTKTWPTGAACEVISTEALGRALMLTTDNQDREHVTRWFYRNLNACNVVNLESPDPHWSEINLAIDNIADLKRARKIAAKADIEGKPGMKRIVEIAKSIDREQQQI